MLVCIFGTPFSLAASVRGRWLIGSHWCRWYGFANALFGVVSMVSLAVLSYERYSALVCSSRPDCSDYTKAWWSIGGSWLYSLAWTVPPLLGWSSYGLEGPGTTCSVQWHQRSAGTRSYVSCLFFFCLFLPLLSMLFCYGRILLAIRGVSRVNQPSAKLRDSRALVMVVSMVTCYLLCWLPYGIVALVATFGRPGLVPPAASLVPSLLAKTSTVLNPFIYVLFNNQFYRCCLALVKCRSETCPTPALPSLPSRGDPNPASSTCYVHAIYQGSLEIMTYPEVCDPLDMVKVKGHCGSQEVDTSQ
ncbi:teleost multiple tissue opsin 3b [Aplochiton taeniatus]